MLKFDNLYRERKRVFSVPGSSEVLTYRPVIGDSGAIDLIQDGMINIYDQIQSHKDSCDVNLMIKRFENGDLTALGTPRDPVYMDVTDMPKTYAELYQKVIDAKNEFNALPLDLREKFDFDPDKYISQMGTAAWFDVMQDYYKPAPDPTISNPTIPDPVGGDPVE